MMTARVSLMCSTILTIAALAVPVSAQTIVGSAEDAIRLGGLLPDIIEEIPKHLSIQNTRQREFLRFSTTHWNFGDGALQIRGGGQESPCVVDGVQSVCTFAKQEIFDANGQIVAVHDAGVALFHPEHNHWHQSEVAEFAIRKTPDGAPLGSLVFKTTFCLIDLDSSDLVHEHKTKVYWDCDADLQGISVGYGDPYHQALEGQEIEITDLPAGDYYLTFDVDPEQHWIELDDTNNRSWTKFRLGRQGANPSITVLETSGYEGNTSNN
jgi:hypothetical protein